MDVSRDREIGRDREKLEGGVLRKGEEEGLIFKLENEVSSDMSYFWYSDGVVVMFDL